MKYKNQKLLFLLSQNCREGLKQLGSELKQSPQTTSYQINKLEEEECISYKTIVDHIRLGYSNLYLGLNLRQFSNENKQKALSALKKAEYVVSVFEGRNGVDLIVEVKARNLSAFNKTHTEFMHQNGYLFSTKFVSPIIVRHSYPRNYLIKKLLNEDIITLGDREVLHIDEDESLILNLLEKFPKMTLVEMSQKTNLGIKKITNIKRNLEKQKIIRKYTCIFDYQKLEIKKQLIFLKFDDETLESLQKITQYAKQNQHCVELSKVIGHFNLILAVEYVTSHTVLEEIRELFPVDDHLVVNIVKQI
jgi:DNA-binding Lrp family transcriptional regulator